MSDWYQQSLTPPEVVEIRVRIGLIQETDHVQALVEAIDPLTGVLFAQASIPHRPLRQMGTVIEWALTKARDLAHDSVDPF